MVDPSFPTEGVGEAVSPIVSWERVAGWKELLMRACMWSGRFLEDATWSGMVDMVVIGRGFRLLGS
jgi:hypothetical protein